MDILSPRDQKMLEQAYSKLHALISKRELEDKVLNKISDCSEPNFVREQLGLSQKEFCLLFGFSTQNWEQQRRIVKPYQRLLLYLIYSEPLLIADIYKEEKEQESDVVKILDIIRNDPEANAVLRALTQ